MLDTSALVSELNDIAEMCGTQWWLMMDEEVPPILGKSLPQRMQNELEVAVVTYMLREEAEPVYSHGSDAEHLHHLLPRLYIASTQHPLFTSPPMLITSDTTGATPFAMTFSPYPSQVSSGDATDSASNFRPTMKVGVVSVMPTHYSHSAAQTQASETCPWVVGCPTGSWTHDAGVRHFRTLFEQALLDHWRQDEISKERIVDWPALTNELHNIADTCCTQWRLIEHEDLVGVIPLNIWQDNDVSDMTHLLATETVNLTAVDDEVFR